MLADGLVLVTDAIPAMGLPAGQHHIGSQLVEIKGKRAVIAGTETLCGRYGFRLEGWGEHHIGSQLVEIKEKRAVIAGTETLCGRYGSRLEGWGGGGGGASYRVTTGGNQREEGCYSRHGDTVWKVWE